MNNDRILAHLKFTVRASTHKMYQSIYAGFGHDLATVEKVKIWEYIELLRTRCGLDGRELSWKTIRKNLVAISSGIEAAIRLGLREENPMPRILRSLRHKKSGARRRTEALSPENVRAILLAPKAARDHALMSLLFYGGLRISEALKLNIGDIRLVNNTIQLLLKDTKNGDDALFELNSEAVGPIITLITKRLNQGAKTKDPLFIGDLGSRYCRKTAYENFREVTLEVLGEKHGTHTGRATAITQLLCLGVQHRLVRDFARHGSINMTEVYEDRRKSIDDNAAKRLSYG